MKAITTRCFEPQTRAASPEKLPRFTGRQAPKKTALLCFSISLFIVSGVWAAATHPAVLRARQEAETKGFVFETRHDEIVAKARKEGNLRALIGWDPANYPPLIAAFKKKYPFIDVHLEEIGSDAAQRFVLEMKAGRVKGWDVIHIHTDYYTDFHPFLKRFDILGMAEHKVLSVPSGMIDPRQRNLLALGNLVDVVAYNKNLISREQVPASWEDFLKPEFKGKKFLVDIRPLGYAALVPTLGLEWALEYAKKLAAQEPVWVRGFTRAYAAIMSGEYAFHSLGNYNAIMRQARKDPSGSLQFKVIEPIPVRIHEPQGVYRSAANPYAALLWLEFEAGSEAQKIIDRYEPLKSSIHSPGAEVAKLIQGRKISVKGWDNWEDYTKWVGLLTEAFGFPKAQIK